MEEHLLKGGWFRGWEQVQLPAQKFTIICHSSSRECDALSGLWEHCMHVVHRHTCRHNTHFKNDNKGVRFRWNPTGWQTPAFSPCYPISPADFPLHFLFGPCSPLMWIPFLLLVVKDDSPAANDLAMAQEVPCTPANKKGTDILSHVTLPVLLAVEHPSIHDASIHCVSAITWRLLIFFSLCLPQRLCKNYR